MPGKGRALAFLFQRSSGPGILVRRGRKWSSTMRRSRNLGGLFLGPSPGGITSKSRSASEVIGDSGDGFFSSMFEDGSREFQIVEGEALGGSGELLRVEVAGDCLNYFLQSWIVSVDHYFHEAIVVLP